MMYGANLEDMERLAQVVQQAVQRLDGEKGEINALMRNASWQGRDADQFLFLWSSVLLGQMTAVVYALNELAMKIRKHLNEQDDASSHEAPKTWLDALGYGIARAMRDAEKTVRGEIMRHSAVESFLRAYPPGKPVEYNGDARYGRGYKYQCVDYVQAYTGHIYGLNPKEAVAATGAGDASTLFSRADPAYFDKISLNDPVKVGDIVCLGGGAYGHVAVVTKVNDDGSYLVADQDGLAATDAGRSPKIHRLSEWQLRHVQGYLRPKADKIKVKLPTS